MRRFALHLVSAVGPVVRSSQPRPSAPTRADQDGRGLTVLRALGGSFRETAPNP
jgi:hypothetical protein